MATVANGDVSHSMDTIASDTILCIMATGLNWQPQSPEVIFPVLWPQALMATVASGDISCTMATGLNGHSRQR